MKKRSDHRNAPPRDVIPTERLNSVSTHNRSCLDGKSEADQNLQRRAGEQIRETRNAWYRYNGGKGRQSTSKNKRGSVKVRRNQYRDGKRQLGGRTGRSVYRFPFYLQQRLPQQFVLIPRKKHMGPGSETPGKLQPILPEAFRIPTQLHQNLVQSFAQFFAVALQPSSTKVLLDGNPHLMGAGIVKVNPQIGRASCRERV